MRKNNEVIVYSAEASRRSFFFQLLFILRDLPQAHELGLRLFKRSLKAYYRQSLLGFAWALLPPLVTAGLWIFLRGGNVVSLGETGIPYPVFVLTGTLLWQVFTEAILAPLTQATENRGMLSKINIPREGLLLAGLYQLGFNTALKLLLLAVIFLYFRQPVSPAGLAFALPGLAALILAGFAVGLALTPLGMLFKDIERGLAIVLPFLMYLTPVVYPAPRAGTVALFMKLNPLATLLTQTRNGLTAQPVYDLPLFCLLSLAFGLLFLVGLVVYRLAMPMIIERIGA